MSFPRLLLTLLLALVPATACGQPLEMREPQEPQRIRRTGTEVFRWLLHRAGLKPMTDGELSDAIRRRQLSDTVVILMVSWNNAFPGGQHVPLWVTAAVENGGAVMVVTDQSTSLSPGGGLPHIFFNGSRVFTPQPAVGPWLVLNQNEIEQFAVPFDPPAGGGPEWELFGGDRPLRRVVNELPATLAGLKGSTLTPLAGFPPNARFRDGRGLVAPTDNVFVAGVAGRHPRTQRGYRFLAVADPAVFHNGQMVASDQNGPTDNLEFADRAVRFLTEEGGVKQRTKCLLIEENRIERDYDKLNQMLRPPLPPLPKVDWEKLQPKLVDLGNQILDKVQENDIPNKLVAGKNPDEPRSWFRALLGVLLTMAALWAAFALVRRVWGAREPTDLATAPPGGRPPPPPDGAAGVFGRRGKELATRDNLLEPARAACRDFFDTVGRPPEPGPRLPKVVISDVVRKPDTLRNALRDLWAVAYGRPAPVTAMRWAALEPLLGRALTAHRDGKWRFVEADAWPDVSTRSRGEA
jgi:hypothetical protein